MYNVKGRGFDRWITEPVHHIEAGKLHDYIVEKLDSSNIKLNNIMTPEFALQEGAFVIDVRSQCYFKNSGFKKNLVLEVEVMDEHHLIAPVLHDGNLSVKGHGRQLSYFPLDKKRLLITDSWYSENRLLNLHEMRNVVLEVLSVKGWKLGKVIRESAYVSEIPLSPPAINEERYVINLRGLFHDTTGSTISMATELIEQMVNTSFRYGELKEVVRNFRREKEIDRQFLRFLNRLLIKQKQHQVFDIIYKQNFSLIERYSRGQVRAVDRYRILAGKSNYEVGHLLKSLKLSNVFTLTRMSNSSAS
jgi:hypothetical protein